MPPLNFNEGVNFLFPAISGLCFNINLFFFQNDFQLQTSQNKSIKIVWGECVHDWQRNFITCLYSYAVSPA